VRVPTVSPSAYARVAALALAALALIVLTGAAVRLTDSGLGCPDWPKCYGRAIPPLNFHSSIEFGNRMLTGVVGLAVIATCALAFRRRPYRRHLAVLGALLPLGVVAQAVLGGLVVRYHLAPQLVIGHYILSMVLLDAAFALFWCAAHEPGWREPSHDRMGVWAVRGLVPLGQLTILLGTISTGSGPHAGAHEGDLVGRFQFRGGETLAWIVTRHGVMAALFGVAAVGVWLFVRRRGGDRRALAPLTLMCVLLALQGVVGIAQYRLELPAGLVWVHVGLATANWLCVLWAVGAAGRLVPSPAAGREPVAAAVATKSLI
jgi:cytochrome c oxidase assembly protein subunit 15